MTIQTVLRAALAFVALIGLSVGSVANPPAEEWPHAPIATPPGSGCTPSFVNVAVPEFDEELEGRPAYAWSADAFLIGCAQQLTLSQADHRNAQQLLQAVILRENMGIFARAQDPTFRADLAARINAQLQRRIVSDIILLVSRGEYDLG